MSDSFSANVSVAEPPQSLFFVSGRGAAPDPSIRAIGAKVLTRLSGHSVLAIGPFAQMRTLASHPEIATAGPINIDNERFAAFTAIARNAARAQAGRNAAPQATP